MADGDLTTVDAVKRHLNMTSATADAVIQDHVTASSAWAMGELNRPLLSGTYTEPRDGNGHHRMLLNQCPPTDDDPPISVTSVTVDGVVIPKRPDVTADDPDPDGWILRDYGIDLSGCRFNRGRQNVLFVYTVGYDTIPADLELAVRIHAALSYQRRGRELFSSTSAMGDTASMAPSTDSFAFVMDVIKRYRALGAGR